MKGPLNVFRSRILRKGGRKTDREVGKPKKKNSGAPKKKRRWRGNKTP